jgi:hypothetical protein
MLQLTDEAGLIPARPLLPPSIALPFEPVLFEKHIASATIADRAASAFESNQWCSHSTTRTLTPPPQVLEHAPAPPNLHA